MNLVPVTEELLPPPPPPLLPPLSPPATLGRLALPTPRARPKLRSVGLAGERASLCKRHRGERAERPGCASAGGSLATRELGSARLSTADGRPAVASVWSHTLDPQRKSTWAPLARSLARCIGFSKAADTSRRELQFYFIVPAADLLACSVSAARQTGSESEKERVVSILTAKAKCWKLVSFSEQFWC